MLGKNFDLMKTQLLFENGATKRLIAVEHMRLFCTNVLFSIFGLPPSLQSIIERCDNILHFVGIVGVPSVTLRAYLNIF